MCVRLLTDDAAYRGAAIRLAARRVSQSEAPYCRSPERDQPQEATARELDRAVAANPIHFEKWSKRIVEEASKVVLQLRNVVETVTPTGLHEHGLHVGESKGPGHDSIAREASIFYCQASALSLERQRVRDLQEKTKEQESQVMDSLHGSDIQYWSRMQRMMRSRLPRVLLPQ